MPARRSALPRRLVALGLIGGLLSGLLGVGGGVFIVPLLVLGVGLDQHVGQATSLAAVMPSAMVATLTLQADGQRAARGRRQTPRRAGPRRVRPTRWASREQRQRVAGRA
jgi:Sulfite exporter TauE/SafE